MTWDGVVLAPGLGHSRRAAVDAFVGFLISATVQDRIAAAGRAIPARRASLKAYLEGPRPKCRSPFVDSLAYARLESVAPAYIQLDVIVTREMQRFLDPHDGRTARQFLEELRRDSFIVEHLGEGLPP